MERIVRKKLYKAGKLWVVGATAVGMMMLLNPEVHANANTSDSATMVTSPDNQPLQAPVEALSSSETTNPTNDSQLESVVSRATPSLAYNTNQSAATQNAVSSLGGYQNLPLESTQLSDGTTIQYADPTGKSDTYDAAERVTVASYTPDSYTVTESQSLAASQIFDAIQISRSNASLTPVSNMSDDSATAKNYTYANAIANYETGNLSNVASDLRQYFDSNAYNAADANGPLIYKQALESYKASYVNSVDIANQTGTKVPSIYKTGYVEDSAAADNDSPSGFDHAFINGIGNNFGGGFDTLKVSKFATDHNEIAGVVSLDDVIASDGNFGIVFLNTIQKYVLQLTGTLALGVSTMNGYDSDANGWAVEALKDLYSKSISDLYVAVSNNPNEATGASIDVNGNKLYIVAISFNSTGKVKPESDEVTAWGALKDNHVYLRDLNQQAIALMTTKVADQSGNKYAGSLVNTALNSLASFDMDRAEAFDSSIIVQSLASSITIAQNSAIEKNSVELNKYNSLATLMDSLVGKATSANLARSIAQSVANSLNTQEAWDSYSAAREVNSAAWLQANSAVSAWQSQSSVHSLAKSEVDTFDSIWKNWSSVSAQSVAYTDSLNNVLKDASDALSTARSLMKIESSGVAPSSSSSVAPSVSSSVAPSVSSSVAPSVSSSVAPSSSSSVAPSVSSSVALSSSSSVAPSVSSSVAPSVSSSVAPSVSSSVVTSSSTSITPNLSNNAVTSAIINKRLKKINAHSATPKDLSMYYYTVVKGDSLWAIAQRYGIALNDLIRANPNIKNSNLIYPGDLVFITRTLTLNHYAVRAGDTLWDIARRFNISLEDLIDLNPQIMNINLIYPGDIIKIK
ncbi:LysM peptidoglycan-binding domain-containing protein [Weissella confusa]